MPSPSSPSSPPSPSPPPLSSPSPPPPPPSSSTIMAPTFHRRRTSDRAVAAPISAQNDAGIRQQPNDARLTPSSLRGMRRLEMRRSMEESHFMAQKARSASLNPPVDMRMLDYVSDYDRNLMCPICRCPFVDPVVLVDCDHCFCRDCLSQTWTEYHPGGPRGSCPTCRRESRLAAKTSVSKILLNILDELAVACPNRDDGCMAEIKRGEVQHHVNLYCGYAFVDCPRPDCEQPIRRKDAAQCLHYGVSCIDCHGLMFLDNLEHHWRRECPDRQVACPHCKDTIYYRTLDLHTKDACPAITTPCKGTPYGCSFRSKRGDLDIHSKSCIFAKLAPTFEAQQDRINQQDEFQKTLVSKLSILESGFDKLEKLFLAGLASDLIEPTNPADPERIPLTLEARVRRPGQSNGSGSEDGIGPGSEQIQENGNHHSRVESTTSLRTDADFPITSSGRISRLGQQRLGYISPGPAQQDLAATFFQSAEDPYDQSHASSIQHLLSLHESLRDEVTRIAAAMHDLDGRHSMLMLNENLRLKEDMAFLNAQVSGIGRQVSWLMSRGLQSQQAQSSQSQSTRNDGDGESEISGRNSQEGSAMQNAVTALRGAARVVNLTRSQQARDVQVLPRRAGSDEGRTKL